MVSQLGGPPGPVGPAGHSRHWTRLLRGEQLRAPGPKSTGQPVVCNVKGQDQPQRPHAPKGWHSGKCRAVGEWSSKNRPGFPGSEETDTTTKDRPQPRTGEMLGEARTQNLERKLAGTWTNGTLTHGGWGRRWCSRHGKQAAVPQKLNTQSPLDLLHVHLRQLRTRPRTPVSAHPQQHDS